MSTTFDKPLFREHLHLALEAGRIETPDFAVGMAILRFADGWGKCWPAHATLAAKANVCVRTVQRALHELRRAGLLDWERRKCAWNRNLANLYRLLAPKEKVENRSPAPESDGKSPRPLGKLLGGAFAKLEAAILCSSLARSPVPPRIPTRDG